MASVNSGFIGILTTLLVQFPLYLVWFTGIIIAFLNIKKYPKISTFALIAFVICILETIIFSIANTSIPLIAHQHGWALNSISIFYTISGIVHSLLSTAVWCLVIAAIFSCRTKEDYMKSLDR
jgi:hypothetical protein